MRRWPGSRWPPGACRQDAVGRSGALSRRGWVLFTLVGVIWGVPYLLIKVADGGVSVPVLVFARTAIGSPRCDGRALGSGLVASRYSLGPPQVAGTPGR